MADPPSYDALLIVSFGGPEGPDDVLGFLENVLRGRNVPRQRMLEVAQHYQRFGGVSPLNAQNRALRDALQPELARRLGRPLPVYLGNRNWHPLLPDTLRHMARDGVRGALAWFTSAYSSYSSCRQYLENVADAQRAVGPDAPEIDRLRAFYNHPGFIEPMVERVRQSLARTDPEGRDELPLLFSAHSLPTAMARRCRYEHQLRQAAQLVVERLGGRHPWQLVYQSRSGPPQQPWLEPDVSDAIRELAAQPGDAAARRTVVVVPIGFISDHIEVLYDLDVEAANTAAELGWTLVRAATVGTHPRFIEMICQLVAERLDPALPRLALGPDGPHHDLCPPDCCPPR